MFDLVFCDLHGVLADFVQGWCELTGRRQPDAWPDWSLEQTFGLSTQDVWQPIHEAGQAWWANLPATIEAAAILKAADTLSRSGAPAQIVTSPASPLVCRSLEAAGSTQLVAERFLRRAYIVDAKHHLAGPRRLLIDDNPQQVERWRAAGGAAVLVPRPWNGGAVGVRGVAATVKEDLKRLVKATAPFVCDVPLPPDCLRPNSRGKRHYNTIWASKRHYKNACKDRVKAGLLQAKIKPPGWTAATITAEYSTTGNAWDQDNAIASLKNAIDALVVLGVLADDRGCFWAPVVFHRVKTAMQTGVRLTISPK